MAYNAQYDLSPCPFCGKDAQYRQDRDGDTYFYIASCGDMTCDGYNEETFDNKDACCKWWNNAVLAWKERMKDDGEPEESQDVLSSDIAVSAITAKKEEGNYLITLTAVGENIDENAICTWSVVFNADNYIFVSIGPVLAMTNTQSILFNAASVVKASVGIGGYASETFTVKE